jgi:hypothetical protein
MKIRKFDILNLFQKQEEERIKENNGEGEFSYNML